MKTIEIPTMSKDEIDMLDGLSGQMSDGAGENCSWCHNYWPHMNGFENKDGKSYFTFQEMGAFKDKADAEIIKDIGKRFNQICKKLNEAVGLVYVKMDDERARPFFDESNCILGSKDFGPGIISHGATPIIQLILINDDFKFRVATEIERLYGGYSFNVFDSAKYIEINNIEELRTAVEDVARKLYKRMKNDKIEELAEAIEAL